MKRILSVVVIALLLAGASRAATSLRGFVIDATSEEPLPVANVVVKGTNRGSSTNLDGFFLIPGLKPGDYTLEVSYLGYRPASLEVTLPEGDMEPVTIPLIPQGVQLEEVTYTVQEKDEEAIRESPRVSTVPVDARTIRRLPSLGGEMDVLRAVQAIPGVKATSELSSSPVVRGGSPDMTLILMDQSTVYNPNHLFGLFSTFNADAVKRLELMKGGFPAEYGGRAGSVLEVVTNDGNRKEFEGLFSVGIVSAKLALEGPLPGESGSYALSGRRTYFDPLLAAMEAGDDALDLPDYFFYDGNGKLNFDLTSTTTLTLGGYLGLDDMDFEFGDYDARALLETYWGNRTATARLRQVVGNSSFLTAGFAYSRYRSGATFWDQDENTGDDILIQDFRNRFNDIAFRTDYEYLGLKNHRIKAGVQASWYSVDVDNGNEDVTFVNIDTTTANYSAYVQDKWRINPLLEIQPGVRMYWHEDQKDQFFDPRFSVMYSLTENMRFKFATGRYHQFVNVISAGEGFSFFDIWVPNDGSVDPTYVDQFVLGWEWDFNADHELTVESYYNDMNDVYEYDSSVDRGQDMADAFIAGKGRAFGVEFMARRKHGPITGWVGYSLSWSQRRFENSYINNGDWYYPKYDRRHDFLFIGSWRVNKAWELSAQWRYNTGQGYTQAIGVYPFRLDGVEAEDLNSQFYKLYYGDKNNYRYPADHRLDLSASYSHQFFGKLPAKLTFSIYNAYSRRAVFTRTFDTSENPAEYTDVKLLPILPLVAYEVRF